MMTSHPADYVLVSPRLRTYCAESDTYTCEVTVVGCDLRGIASASSVMPILRMPRGAAVRHGERIVHLYWEGVVLVARCRTVQEGVDVIASVLDLLTASGPRPVDGRGTGDCANVIV
jgi:hypothetical protein